MIIIFIVVDKLELYAKSDRSIVTIFKIVVDAAFVHGV
ncbi:MAG: hypothetical protein ACJASH_001571, partial [Bermanella sp.]